MRPTAPLFTTLLLLFACQGADGKAGADGSDGTNGTDGTDGADGAAGSDGTDGTNGTDGTDGTNGTDGEDVAVEPTALSVTITGVAITGPPVVTFAVTDQDGVAFSGFTTELLSARAFRFTVAQLQPGADGDADAWQSYINTTEDTSTSTAGPDGVPVLASATQATNEYAGTLAYLGDGVYTYTFAADVTAITTPVAVTYDDTLLHRVAIQIEYPLASGEELIYNPTFDWVPSGGTAPATRTIVKSESCNECHDGLALHGGGRIELDYCVTCHNPGTTDANSGNTVNLAQMVHKIHMGNELTEVADNGGTYTIWGYQDSEHDYSHVGFPQDQENCIKCHDPADAETPDAINYLERPTMEACGACHDAVDFATGENHDGGAQANNSNCALCHSSTAIDGYHLTDNATPNNPSVSAGLSVVEYELVSAAVDANRTLTVEYTITRDGTAIDCSALDSDLTGGPTFLLPYAGAEEGFDAPAEWNNSGLKAGQPATVSIASLVAGSISGGTHSYSAGVNTMVYASAYPEGSTMRAVALQGYYSQTLDSVSYGRHAVSKWMTVSGDAERRVVVDPANCANCHEWFEGHGGNRVYETQVCVMCHNPSLSSSGRELDLTHPEASNNFKDMIHGIHGASVRDYPLDFVRNRSGGTRYTFLGDASQLEEYPDGHVIEFPASPSNCTLCHAGETYLPEAVPSQSLLSTFRMGDEATTVTEYTAFRTSMPNDTDWIIGPTAAACLSCHNSDLAEAHMDQNGGAVLWSRSEWQAEEPYETCALCHGDGGIAAVSDVHGL